MRSDPIGLLRREHAFADVHQLYVHPRTTVLPATSAGLIRDLEGSPTRRLVDSDMSFHAIREYTAGDSRRQIHWKSTAKTGRLMVRQYEESRRSRMAVVLAAAEAEFADAGEFELAVSSAASLGLRAVRDARDVAIVTGSEIPRVVRGRLRAITHLPAASPRAMLDAFSGVGLIENTMPVAEVCRSHRRGGRPDLDRVRRRRLAGAAQPAAAGGTHVPHRHGRHRGDLRRTFPSAHAVARRTHRAHDRDPRRSGGPAAAGGDVVTEMDAVTRPERPPFVVPRVLAGTLYSAVVVALAALAAWPIYRSWHFGLLVGVATAVAAGIAVVAWRRRWSGWLVAGVLGAVFLLAGVPLAVPSRLGAPAEILRGLGEVVSGVVLGWKDLITVDLPVGAYRNLLVPALVIFLIGTCAMLLLSWRDDAVAYAAVPVGIAMVSFGLFFGRTTVSPDWIIGPVSIYAPVETALGLASLLAGLLWLAWRTHDERFRALQRAAASSGVRVSRRPSSADRRRTALGGAMVLIAIVVVTAVVPAAARGIDRDVLRASVGPDVELAAAVSPLAEYRSLFTDDRADDVLFTVTPEDGTLPERVRLATLDAYDGEIYRSGGSDSQDAGRFVRVPSVLDAGAGTPVRAEVTIGALSGIWMPTLGQLSSVGFQGPRASSLADRFYDSAAAAAGVETAGGGLERGDSYIVQGVERPASDLAAVEAPGGVSKGVAAPDSPRTWVGITSRDRAAKPSPGS